LASFVRSAVVAAAAGAALMSSIAMSSMTSAPSAAAEAAVVYPGMEIRQDSTVCTLGFVDVAARIAYSAGHCRGSGLVTDRNGRFIGVVTTSRDNTPDGTVVRTDQVISDYQTISLAAGVTANNVLPSGRQLVTDAAATPAPGQQVCHFGVITGESCGTIERVNNGWFTMENGVVSQKGDSGGPVYTFGDGGQAVLIGLFNSTWGNLPAAVSWQATSAQLAADIASGSVINAAAKN
jgi:hypothetical protein